MVAVGDVLQIKDVQSFDGLSGEVLNVYYYKVTAVMGTVSLPLSAEDFTLNFNDAFLSVIRLIQSVDTAHVRLEVNNLMNYDTDFFSFTYDTPLPGLAGGVYAAASTALSFQLVRQFRTTRNGSKRIGGTPYTWIHNNAALEAHSEDISSVQTILSSGLTIDAGGGNELSMVPVILKSPVSNTVPPTVINNVTGAAFRGVGTQNTRKELLP